MVVNSDFNHLCFEFDYLDLNDPNSVLIWLNKMYYYNDDFISLGKVPFCKYVYKKLSDAGYKPITEDNDALIEYRKLLSEKKNISAKIELEKIMPFIKGNKGVDKAIIGELIKYNLKNNRKEALNIQIDALKSNIGKNVTYEGHINGVRTPIKSGVLESIQEPSKLNGYTGYVRIKNDKNGNLLFLGATSDLENVFDENDNVIFYNDYAGKYDGENIQKYKANAYKVLDSRSKDNKSSNRRI